MERLILDAGAVIALDRGAVDDDALPAEADVAISAITAAELLVGVELAGEPRQSRRSTLVEGVLDRAEILGYDLTVARHHAVLLAHVRETGPPRLAHDLQIAATARAADRTVITTDASAFQGLPGVRHRVLG